jgi:hypothetical protein
MLGFTGTTIRAGALALAVAAWMVPGALRAEEGKADAKPAAKPATAAQIKAYPIDKCVVTGEKLGGMGDPVDMVVKNHLIRLCCAGCKKAVLKDPDKYLAMVKEAAAKKK